MNGAVLTLLLLAAALYGWLVHRYDAKHARRLDRWHVAAFGATMAVLYFALEPPLEPLADGSFLAHMAQHMLLVYVAAPLFLLSAPMMLVLGSLDLAHARTVGRLLSTPLWRFVTFPVFTWLFFMAVMWGAHFSPLYELALTYPAVHVLEHALFLTSAILFWQAIIHIGPVSWPMNFPLRIVYVFLAMPQGAFLGLALYQSHFVLYPHYVATHGGSAAAALADQHAGGALMWIVGGLLLFVLFMFVVAMWGRSEQRLGERLDARLESPLQSGSILGTIFALALFGWCTRSGLAATQDQGQMLYQIHCSSCHGASLEGSANAPSLRNVSTDAVDFYLTTG
ncbi:MAG TPA: cytochrome c oxidase assembly protein, partial [Pirellulales bacterium]